MAVAATAGILSGSDLNATINGEAIALLRKDFFQSKVQRGVALVSGPIGCGKKSTVAVAAEKERIPLLCHFGTRDRRPLSALATLKRVAGPVKGFELFAPGGFWAG